MLVKNGLSVFVDVQPIYNNYANSLKSYLYFFNVRRISR